jgi:hypothetical protein
VLQGEHAHRIWHSIYSQNCFKNIHSEACDEESLVFYRIISGVHTSISMHIAREYLLYQEKDLWGINMDIFRERMSSPSKCDHVRNLYFTYLFVSKAVARAAPALKQVHFQTGMVEEDTQTQVLSTRCLAEWQRSRVLALPCGQATANCHSTALLYRLAKVTKRICMAAGHDGENHEQPDARVDV